MLFVLDWQRLLAVILRPVKKNAPQNGEVNMDCRIGNTDNMQVRLQFFSNESWTGLID